MTGCGGVAGSRKVKGAGAGCSGAEDVPLTFCTAGCGSGLWEAVRRSQNDGGASGAAACCTPAAQAVQLGQLAGACAVWAETVPDGDVEST